MRLVTCLFITLVYFGGLYPSGTRAVQLYPHNQFVQIAFTMLWPFPMTALALTILLDEYPPKRLK